MADQLLLLRELSIRTILDAVFEPHECFKTGPHFQIMAGFRRLILQKANAAYPPRRSLFKSLDAAYATTYKTVLERYAIRDRELWEAWDLLNEQVHGASAWLLDDGLENFFPIAGAVVKMRWETHNNRWWINALEPEHVSLPAGSRLFI